MKILYNLEENRTEDLLPTAVNERIFAKIFYG
jgi:hypothetical protein